MPGELVGRGPETTLLETVLDAGRWPWGLAIGGDPGIGKTAFWRAGISTAEARGYRVLSARPVAVEASLPFTAIADLLDPVLDELAVLPPPQRHALEVALLRVPPAGPSPDERALAVGLLGLVRHLSRISPVLLALDDVQWLDRPSALVLSFALRRLSSEPVGLLVAARTDDGGAERLDPATALPAHARLERIAMGPLSLGAVDHIIRERLDVSLPRSLLVRVHETSAGNPFVALEITSALARTGARPHPREPLPIPDDLQKLLLERIRSLSSDAQHTLLVAAAVARPTADLVEAVTGSAQGLADVVDAGILESHGGRLAFAHPLLASAAYGSIAAAGRRDLHRRIAEMVGDPDESALHLALAAEGPDSTVAAALAEAAGRISTRSALAAAELHEEAARLTPAELADDRSERLSEAAWQHFRSGDGRRAAALLASLVDTLPPGSTRALALSRLGALRLGEESLDSAEQLFRRASDEPAMPAEVRAFAALGMAWSANLRLDLAPARAHAHEAIRLADPAGREGTLSAALSVLGQASFLAGFGVDAALMARAVATAEQQQFPLSSLRPDIVWGPVLKWSGDLDGARELLDHARAHAEERGEEHALAIALYHLAELECWAGDLVAADRNARAGEAVAAWSGLGSIRAASLYARGLVDSYRGLVDSARTAAEQGLRLADHSGAFARVAQNRSVLGFLELSLGDAHAAEQQLAPLIELIPLIAPPEPGVLRFVPDAIQVLIELDRLDQAAGLLRAFEARADATARPWALAGAARCRGLLLAAGGDLEGALAALAVAVERHRSVAEPFELGRTLLAMGTVERRAKRRSRARETLGRALGIFDQVRTPLWAATTRAELGRIGGRSVGPSGLTPTEERVADLVAQGLSNAETARTLNMSVKTVESTLTRVYSKVGVRSRSGLAARRSKV